MSYFLGKNESFPFGLGSGTVWLKIHCFNIVLKSTGAVSKERGAVRIEKDAL
jgi:hypothetical protein